MEKSKPTPPVLSPKKQQQLALMKRLAWILDSSIAIPGTKFRIGLDALIGLIPWLGDIVGAILSFGILVLAVLFGASGWTVLRMSLNVGVELVVGLIPFVGDVFDAIWKANERNIKLLERGIIKPNAGRRDLLFLVTLSMGFVAGLGLFIYTTLQIALWLYELVLSSVQQLF